jgi:hypothetical protein
VADAAGDVVVQAEADDAVIVAWKGRVGLRPGSGRRHQSAVTSRPIHAAAPRMISRRLRAEAVWSHLRRSIANLTKHNIGQLTALVKAQLKQMQCRPGLLDGLLLRDRPRPDLCVTLIIYDL